MKQKLSKLHDDLNSFLYQKLTPIEKLGEGVGAGGARGEKCNGEVKVQRGNKKTKAEIKLIFDIE